jgi:hypothetical protein
VYSGTTTETIVLDNSAIADGVATDDATTNNCRMELAAGLVVYDEGENLETDAAPTNGTSACDLGTTKHNLFTASAKLGPLADNGGATETELPQPGSPLLRAGGACLDPQQTPAVPLTTDQRGDPRGTTCDIGAVQVQAAAVVGAPTLAGIAEVGQTLTCSAAGAFTGEGLAYSYAWLRNATPIAGQAATTYTLQPADAGTTVTCSVTATGIAGPSVTAATSTPVRLLATLTTAQMVAGVPQLIATKLVDAGGRVELKLRCPAGTSGCAGKLKLTFAIKRTKKRTTTVTLGSGSYRLAAGKSETLTLKLSGRVRGLLASHRHRLLAKLPLSPAGAKARTLNVTITSPPEKKRKR